MLNISGEIISFYLINLNKSKLDNASEVIIEKIIIETSWTKELYAFSFALKGYKSP